MSKARTVFICQSCGNNEPKWTGQCSTCGEWGSFVEEVMEVSAGSGSKLKKQSLEGSVISLSQVKSSDSNYKRISTDVAELDRVLGSDGKNSGMVPGSLLLIGGEPGIGKSTLLTQVAVNLLAKMGKTSSKKNSEKSIMYVCGEESPSQISIRINRIIDGTKTDLKNKDLLKFVTSTDVDTISAMIERELPELVIVDSVQTITTEDLTGAAGSVGQVREAADRLRVVAKRHHVPIFLVGHVTKEGVISGPKILEHIVDAVLELSGERSGDLRLLRSVKNRFGATDEVGLFKVTNYGYESVDNPSEIFLEHQQKPVAGNAAVCVVEGTRPLSLEVQALVVSSQLAMPRRVGRGIQLSRIQVLSAVLQKHCRLPLGSADIFLSAVGGFNIQEPGADLGLAAAIASSLKNRPIPAKTIFIGEVGLLGEIRSVNMLDRRLKEAKRLGFKKIISTKSHKFVNEVLKELGLLS